MKATLWVIAVLLGLFSIMCFVMFFVSDSAVWTIGIVHAIIAGLGCGVLVWGLLTRDLEYWK